MNRDWDVALLYFAISIDSWRLDAPPFRRRIARSKKESNAAELKLFSRNSSLEIEIYITWSTDTRVKLRINEYLSYVRSRIEGSIVHHSSKTWISWDNLDFSLSSSRKSKIEDS